MGSEHTPGPWHIDFDHDATKVEIVGRPKWRCTRFGVKGEWGVAEIDLDDGDDAVANAHLISAAPDLLAASKSALQALIGVDALIHKYGMMQGIECPAIPELRAAIAKATQIKESMK